MSKASITNAQIDRRTKEYRDSKDPVPEKYPIQPSSPELMFMHNESNRGKHSARSSNYPWIRLEVGQSFPVQGVDIRSLATVAARASKKFGRKFMCYQHQTCVECGRIE